MHDHPNPVLRLEQPSNVRRFPIERSAARRARGAARERGHAHDQAVLSELADALDVFRLRLAPDSPWKPALARWIALLDGATEGWDDPSA
jgi:hypothetical protein